MNRTDAPLRLPRDKARMVIVAAANRGRRSTRRYTLRHLNQCVSIVRNRRLVKPEVLEAAGFNVHGPRHRPGRPEAAA